MPKRIPGLINRNPGIAGVITSILFIAPAYGLWYHENNQTNEVVECVVNTTASRDQSSLQSRNALVTFFDEFTAFLRKIQSQTSVDPLLQSSIHAGKSLGKVIVITDANDLRKCLGD